ncbi:PLP-dependent lyase/thiolase [Candidatus Woesearchaeota archaeon]|nr:PLP-dependent lyase/thiolase [Candidatus Woesearchaeota archaeon]
MKKHGLAEALNRFRVGNTPLIDIKGIEFGLEGILVKDESKNPFGTFKDRKSKDVAQYAHDAGIDYVMAITSGNYGYSLSNFLSSVGVKTLLFVPEDINPAIAGRLRKKAEVIPLDLESGELTTERMKSIAETSGIEGKGINATNFYDDSYLDIFKEIKRELDKNGKKPDYIALPIGSGELFAAALRYYHLSDTKIIGVTTDFKGTIAAMLYAKYRPIMEKITKHGNPEKYEIIKASEIEINNAYQKYKTGLNMEPSAAAAFVALQRHNFKPSDVVVAVNTGKG